MKRFRLLLVSMGRRTFSLPFCTPPLGAISLAAYVRTRFPEADVKVIDQRVKNLSVEQLLQEATFFSPDVIGYSTLTPFAHMLPSLTQGMRHLFPSALQVVGGPHASAFKTATLASCDADVAVIGEGELALKKILEAFLSGATFEDIPGIVWRDREGDIIANPGNPLIVDELDSLPMPAYDLLDMEDYWRVPPMGPLPVRKYLSFFTSRGCPYKCIYCHSIFGHCFRSQSAERIVEDVTYLTRRYDLHEIEFLDDMFNCKPQRVLDFCNLAINRNLNLRINLPNSIRTDILTEEVIDALVAAGLYHASFALESGAPRIQKLIQKNLNIPRFIENVDYATKKGVFAHGFTMMGFPTETENEIRMTIDVANNSSLHSATFFTVTPYPGTKIYELVCNTHPERLESIRYEDKNYSLIRVNFSDVPDDLFFRLQRTAWRRFYLNPRRIKRIIRDYPDRQYLFYYFPKLIPRLLKGIMGFD